MPTEITERIKAYDAAPTPAGWTQLKDWLATKQYPDPMFVGAPDSDDRYSDTDGTWDEVDRCHNYGLLTDAQYQEILQDADKLRAFGFKIVDPDDRTPAENVDETSTFYRSVTNDMASKLAVGQMLVDTRPVLAVTTKKALWDVPGVIVKIIGARADSVDPGCVMIPARTVYEVISVNPPIFKVK